MKLYDDLTIDERFLPAFPPELDIVVWALNDDTVSETSDTARALFSASAETNVHLALVELPARFFQRRN